MGKTDAAPGAAERPGTDKKPHFALFIASAGGLGRLPKGPGTWGSLGGAAIAILASWIIWRCHPAAFIEAPANFWTIGLLPACVLHVLTILVAALGVWSSNSVAKFVGEKDPQYIVIDEVSGQLLTYFMPFTVLNWKSLLLGFILFRVFDIWKPFPARQAESLPGGWGIMADDWIAGVYAAVALYLLRRAGV